MKLHWLKPAVLWSEILSGHFPAIPLKGRECINIYSSTAYLKKIFITSLPSVKVWQGF